MKKIKVLLFSTTVLIGGFMALTNVKNVEAKSTESTALDNSTSQSLNRLKNKGFIFKENLSELLPSVTLNKLEDTDKENTVYSAKGTGIDLDGNIQKLNLTKGSVKDLYYLDDTTLSARATVVNFVPGYFEISMLVIPNGKYTGYDLGNNIIQSKTNIINNQAAVSASVLWKKAYDFYRENFNYLGFDNRETDLERNIVYINASGKVAGTDLAANAFNYYMPQKHNNNQKGSFAGFGKGAVVEKPNGVQYIFDNTAKDSMVVSHEYSHGIVDHFIDFTNVDMNTDAGGLNEGLPDLFAASITHKWIFGEKVNNVAEDGSSFRRNLADPSAYKIPGTDTPYPDKYSDLTGEINGHYSGTILGKMYYLLSEGGSFNGYDISGITIEKSQKILFESLPILAEQGGQKDRPNFTDFRLAMEKSTENIYGVNSPEYESLEKAMNATEIPPNVKW